MNKQQYESNKSILLDAVDTATHVDNDGDYWNMGNDDEPSFFDKRDSVWEFCDPQEPLRKLSDIKTLCVQYERIAELENLINSQVFPSIGDGFSCEYINGYEKALSDLDKALKEQGDEHTH